MKLSMKEKKVLYAFACPNHHNMVSMPKWLTALTVRPTLVAVKPAGRWKLEMEMLVHWLLSSAPC